MSRWPSPVHARQAASRSARVASAAGTGLGPQRAASARMRHRMAYNGVMSQAATQSRRPISVKNERVCRLARELAEIMECSLTEAIRVALRDFHDQEQNRIQAAAETKEIIRRSSPIIFEQIYGKDGENRSRCPHCSSRI